MIIIIVRERIYIIITEPSVGMPEKLMMNLWFSGFLPYMYTWTSNLIETLFANGKDSNVILCSFVNFLFLKLIPILLLTGLGVDR